MPGCFSLPRQAWASVITATAIHITIAVVISVAVSSFILEMFSQGIDATGISAAIVAPMVLGGPSMFFAALKNRQLQFAYDSLEASASLDSLTGCLHHGAFVRATTMALETDRERSCALLVIDADHFKAINDTFGHANGDTALLLIVAAIRASVDSDAIIGRLGGEEFGVFLPGADTEAAEKAGELVRKAVESTRFEAGERSHKLSVSIGGAVASGATGFDEMFRIADERLYGVKKSGRNSTDIVDVAPRMAKTPPVRVGSALSDTDRFMRSA